MSTVQLRPVKCAECHITFSTHPDFLNHLTAIGRHDRSATEREIREQIAAEILAQAQQPCADFDRSCACASCVGHEEALDAVRIARGES